MGYRKVALLLAFASAAPAAGWNADAGLRRAFERARYALEDTGQGSYRGENPAHRLTLEFDGREARLSHPDGSVGFHLSGYGYGERTQQPAQARLTGAGNRVEYRRGDLTEWYVNGPQGLEQGFTLARRPGTDSQGGPLVIAIGISGGLVPRQVADGGAVVFGSVLRYAGLRAVDARGRAMPSRLEAREGEVRLIVDDRDAEYPLVVDPTWTQAAELTAADATTLDYFGDAVSVSGNTAVIGAPTDGNGPGAAYVFVRSAGVWTQQQKLTASDGVVGDAFGGSVSVSGDTAVIGAYGKASDPGVAYVYVRSAGVWTQQQKLTASDGAPYGGFGISVSVSGDTAVIGAYGKASYQGVAYVYVRSGSAWSLQQELAASDGVANDLFGGSVSVSGDTAVIAAFSKTSAQGAVYVFVRSGGAWSPQQELTASDGAAGDYFGVSVSVSGDTAAIGAYVKYDSQGAAYIFHRSGGNWSPQPELSASDAAAGQGFGGSVSVSGDTAVIGAIGSNASLGAAYVFVVPMLGASSLLVGSAGGSLSDVLYYDGPWTATANNTFLHVASGSSSGAASGVVAFSCDPYTGTGSRTGTLTIAGLTVSVIQAGTNYVGPGPLLTLVSSGLSTPDGIAVDGSGNVYIADNGNNAVKEWSAATQQVTSLVSSGLHSPKGLAVDGSGNVYVADSLNNAIKEWSAATQQVSTLASSGLTAPTGLAVDAFGNVYFADSTSAIKEWTAATRQLTTLVPSGLLNPWGVSVDVSGNVYIADTQHNAIKEWSVSTGQVSALESSGLSSPNGLAVDGSGNLYLADSGSSTAKEWNAATGQVSTLVVSGLSAPTGMAVDGSGNVYIADSGSSAIREVPNAFVGPATLTEPAAAGSDSLLPVLPTTTSLTGIFAPTSDQTWLTIGTVSNGVAGFSFTANSTGAARTAHISLLGHQITVTQGAPSALSLTMGTGNGPPGQTAQAPITLASTGTSPAQLQADVSFDQTKLTFASASAGAQLTSAGKSLSATTLANGDVHLATSGAAQTAIAGGVVANVTFTIKPAFTWGTTPVTLKNCGASDALGDVFSATCTAGTIIAFTCDVNGDGQVTVADVQVIINEALGVIPAVHDLNHDGVVNVADVQKEINAALGLGCSY